MKSFLSKIIINRHFMRIWGAQICSLVSAYTLNFVLIGRVFSATQSTVAVSLFLFLYYLPTLVLGPFVGVLVDNLSKRKIFIYSNLLQAIIVLAYLDVKGRVWPLYGIVFVYSLCDEFFNPAVGAILPALVKKEKLTIANSLFFITSQGSIVIGALLGGLIMKFTNSLEAVFITASGLLLLATLLSWLLPKKPLAGSQKIKFDLRNPNSLGKAFALPAFWQQTKQGYAFIKNEPRVLFPIVLLSGLQAIVAMGLIILPPLAGLLRINFADTSYLVITPVIVGVIVGSLILNKKSKNNRKNVIVIKGLFLMGASLLAVSLVTAFTSQLAQGVAVLLTLLLGVSFVLMIVPLQTLLQQSTPFDVRGRVFGALNTGINLASLAPLLLSATLIDIFGLRFVLVLGGAGFLALSIVAQKKKAMVLRG